jgi:hypothetical protein
MSPTACGQNSLYPAPTSLPWRSGIIKMIQLSSYILLSFLPFVLQNKSKCANFANNSSKNSSVQSFLIIQLRIFSANNIKECPIGQKSYKSIQICQIFIFSQ